MNEQQRYMYRESLSCWKGEKENTVVPYVEISLRISLAQGSAGMADGEHQFKQMLSLVTQ